MIKECHLNHLKQCVEIAYLRNSQAENNSAYCPKTKESIHSDFSFIMGNPDSLMVGCFDRERVLGLFGFFVNPESHWVDCIGPFFIGEWDEKAAQEMFAFAQSKLVKATRFNFYFDTRNRNLHRLMEVLSATRGDNEYHLLLEKADYKPQSISHTIVPYSSQYESNVVQLLHDTFPDAYVSAAELIDSVGKNREIFCALNEAGAFVGYGVLKRYESQPSHMTAEIFAVTESERGKGYGWALLNTVIDHALNTCGANSIDLVVDRMNTHAGELYYACGFTLMVENAAYHI